MPGKKRNNLGSLYNSEKERKFNNLYLFLQRRLTEYSNREDFIERKKIYYCLSKHFKFKLGIMGYDILRDMQRQQLIKRINRDKYKLVNLERSEHLQEFIEGIKRNTVKVKIPELDYSSPGVHRRHQKKHYRS